MADIRIKDITTTASSTASGDFFVIDGTTGTRKVNAFNPSFGGNATVTGNLTTNGYTFTSGSLSSFSGTAGIYNYYSSGVGVLASYSDGSGTRAQTQITGSIVSLNTAAGNALTVSAAGVVAIPATTASTTTSSGALVVSGGVGVGGAINAGGAVTVAVGNGVAATLGLNQTGVANAYLTQKATSGDLALGNGGGDQLTISKVAGNVSIVGSMTTAAPSGGTAAAWKLGTVASVSPTSPNRTIEVDIGGTIYYIHAKTTNN